MYSGTQKSPSFSPIIIPLHCKGFRITSIIQIIQPWSSATAMSGAGARLKMSSGFIVSDWWRVITLPEYWPLIGEPGSRCHQGLLSPESQHMVTARSWLGARQRGRLIISVMENWIGVILRLRLVESDHVTWILASDWPGDGIRLILRRFVIRLDCYFR